MALSVDKLKSTIDVRMFDFDPGATTVTAVEWVAMKNYENLLVSAMRTVGTSAVTLTINAATDSSGTDSAVVVTKTVSTEPDAVGDYISVECMAQQIAQKASDDGKAYTHASAVISVATGTDEMAVTYVLGGARFAGSDLTSDNIAT